MNVDKYLDQLKAKSIELSKLEFFPKLNEHQQNVLGTYKKYQFGCQTANVVRFAGAFLQCEMPYLDCIFIPGMIVIPTTNDNNHNYDLGEPVMIMYMDHGFSLRRIGGGNHLPAERSSIRLATINEIEKFYSYMKKCLPEFIKCFNQIDRLPYVE